MVFLIEYARGEGRIVTFKEFEDDEGNLAANTRLELELDLNRRGIQHEVVLLEAENEKALRRTHRRYFETLTELVS
jgi:hypothetical protein